jgi:hypothetical protein
LQVQNESSSSSHNDSSSHRDLYSDHNHQRMRSLHDIYDQDDNVVEFAFFSSQPTCFDEYAKKKEWVDAMNNEIEAIEINNTWDLVDLLADKNVISVKWVYKTKLNEKGEIEKQKVRLVARGFSQQPSIDYGESFAPVARLDIFRIFFAIEAQDKWPIYQMDVKSALLNGVLNEEVYVTQPPVFEVKTQEHRVYKLKKSLYGLKESLAVWFS